MGELFFVLKSLVLAVVVTVLLQMKFGGESLERHSTHWLQHSSVGNFLVSSAEGGADLLRKGYQLANRLVVGSPEKNGSPRKGREGSKAEADETDSTASE